MSKVGIAAGAAIAIALVGYTYSFDNETETASEFYERYRSIVLAGRSFDEDAAFFSAKKRAEVETSQAERGDDSERIEALYLEFTAQLEACETRTLVSEEVIANRTRLVYDIVDCPEYAQAEIGQDIIDLVHENGWKIDSNETRIGD